MPLAQLTYVSRPAPGTTLEDVKAIVAVARTRNATAGVTGLLAYRHDRFVQVLEGPSATVTALLAAIVTDERHVDVALVGCRPIETRTFASWDLGYVAVTGALRQTLVAHTGRAEFAPETLPHDTLVDLLAALGSAAV